MGYILAIGLGFLFAEVFGYFLHILLHSDRIGFLSRNHMIHHLKIYGPKKGLRLSNEYHYAIHDRRSFLGIGMEWWIPILAMSGIMISVLTALGVSPFYQLAFYASSGVWGWAMFNYIHDGMHRKKFWLTENRFLKRWFLNARRNHDIHHLQINNDGLMKYNFGICFFFMDRIFGTYRNRHAPFNQNGYDAAIQRYSSIID